MGNSRHGRTLRPRDGGGTARENASRGPAVLALEATSGTSKTAMDAPLLPRRSGRIAPAPSQESASARFGNVTRPRSKRQKNGAAAAEEARLGVSAMTKNTALGSLLRDSDRSAGSRKGAEEQVSANARDGNASTSLKKRKVTNSRSYIKRFKAVQGSNAAGVVVASPDRVGKENTAGGHVADSNISKLSEGSRLIGKNKRHSSDAVSKVSKILVSGLHETSDTRVNQSSAPFSEEPSTSESRNTEHIEIDNIAKPSMLLGGTTSLVRGVNANYDDTLDTDGVHLESPDLASSQSLVALVGIQAVLSCMSSQQGTDLSAQQNVAPSRCPPAEAGQIGLSGTQVVQVLQPEMQPSILFLDAPPQNTHPDVGSETGCEPDRATGLSEGGTATSHHFGDVRVQFQGKYDGNVAAEPVLQESPTYHADSPVTLHVSTKVEAHICEPSMAAKQSTNPPAQQTSAISRNPPAEVQPFISLPDQPTGAEQAGTLGSIAVQDLQPETQSSTLTQDVPFERTYLSVMPVIQSPVVLQYVGPLLDPHAGVESAGLVIAHDLQSKVQPSASVPSEQSTCLPGEQRLATSQHRPADAEPVGILGTEASCNLQPEVQPSTSMLNKPEEIEDEHEAEDEPAEAEDEPEVPEYEPEVPEYEPEIVDEPAESERARTLGAMPAQDLQPEIQASTSTQVVPFEPTYLPGMPVVQDLAIHRSVEPSLDPHARVESMGMVTAQDLQSEILPSATVHAEQSTSLPAQQSLVTSQHPPAETKPVGILGLELACDLQPEVQPSTSLHDEPAEPQNESEAEDEPEVPEIEDEPKAEGEPEIEDGAAEAEGAGTLGAIFTQDLQLEMQSSTSKQVVPFERTYLSGMPSPDPQEGVESAGMVMVHDLQSEILASSLVPMEQSTTLPAQQSLVTSRHLPANILVTEAACGLQPSQGEVQQPTRMHDQPAEEPACIMGAVAAQSLHPETQPSASMQSAPFERTCLVGMPVVQSPTLHHSLEASLDPHVRAESTHTLGTVTDHDLQSEVQQSASMQNRPAEAEVTVMLGSTAAQDLQPELQSLNTVQDVPLERINSEERRQIGFQPNIVPGPEQPIHIPPVTTLVFNNPILSDEPLTNELDRLMHCNNVLSKDHEHKKTLLLIEYNQEIEKIKKNYDSLLQNEDSTYLQTERELTDLHRKVLLNKSLAENFRGLFPPSPAAQGRSTSPVMEQPFESSSVAQTAASPVILSSAIRPPMHNSPGSYVRPSFVAQPSSSSSSASSWNAQPYSNLPGNLYGTSSSHFVAAPVQYGSYGSAGSQSRAFQPQPALPGNLYRAMSHVPPPCLPRGSYRPAGARLRSFPPHQLRMPSPYAFHAGQQQQLPASNAGSTSLGQYVPVMIGSFASTIPQRGALLNSMDSSSVHQTMLPSASSSLPPHLAYSLTSGRYPQSMVNFLQSSSSNPAFFPAQQSSYQNIALGSTSGLPNAVPGSQHPGAQIARAYQSGTESALLNAHLPARFGLGSSSSPVSAGTSAVVVCLSDDE